MLMINESTRQRYLEALAKTGRFSDAAKGTGYGPSTFVTLRKQDPSFDAAVEEALQLFRESLEAEAHRRGVEGFEEPVYQKGELCGTVRKYSDSLLLAMLKRHVPEYRDRFTMDANLRGGVLVVGGTATDAEEWAKKYGPPANDSPK